MKKNDNDIDRAGWIGYIYRLLQIRTHVSSREIYDCLPNENYLVFLDGKKIDFSNIDPSKYSIKIDDIEKKIILTSNTRRNDTTTTDIVPFLFY